MNSDIKDLSDSPERKEGLLESLSKELNELKSALDESTIVAITDDKGKIIFANEKFCKISKYSREELIGQDHRIINSGHHSKEFIRNLWQTIKNGKTWKGEIRNKAKDGSFYWVDTTIVPFFDGKNVPSQYISIRHDITALKKREKDYRNLFESMTEGFALCEIICDPSGIPVNFRYLAINPAFEKQSGLKASDVVGRCYREIFPQREEQYWVEHFGQVAKTGEPYYSESMFSPLKRWFQISAFQTEPGRFGITFIDITDRKKAEASLLALSTELKQTLDTASTGLTHLNCDMCYLSANLAYLRWVGRTPDQVIGQSIRDVLGEAAFEIIRPRIECVLRGERVEFEDTLPIDGNLKPIHVVYTPDFDTKGGLIGWVASVTDITWRKEAEKQIQDLSLRIIEAQEEERKFISQEIHDNFGQLLIALKIFLANKSVNLIKKSPGLKQLNRALDAKIDEIIENARNLSHKLAPPNFKSIGLKRAVLELVESVNLQRNLSIKYSQRRLSRVNFGPKDLVVYRIIQEALSNIVRHSEAKNAEISLRYKLGKLYVTIKDDGKGFDTKIRLKSSKSLGLALMRERTRLAGGVLKIRSARGAGTQIRLIIPVEEKSNAKE